MIKNWQIIGSAIVATIALLGVLGFNSPASAVAEIRQDLKSVQKFQGEQLILNAEFKKDLGYIKDGIDRIEKRVK